MGGHLDVDQFLGHVREALAVLAADAGEHDLFAGVLVVHTEQTVVGIVGAVRQPDVADVIVVVAELLGLGGGALVHGIEVRRAGNHGIAPTDQDLGGMARRDVMGLVDAMLDLGPDIAAVRGFGGTGPAQRPEGSGQGRGGREPQGAAHHVTAAIAPLRDLAEGVGRVGVDGDVFRGFEGCALRSEIVMSLHVRCLS